VFSRDYVWPLHCITTGRGFKTVEQECKLETRGGSYERRCEGGKEGNRREVRGRNQDRRGKAGDTQSRSRDRKSRHRDQGDHRTIGQAARDPPQTTGTEEVERRPWELAKADLEPWDCLLFSGITVP